ncbi:MAG: shikimate kinase [Nitrososphaerales archaeon]
MIGRAVSHGAITIVNAIATGDGAAMGINLQTEAVVELTRGSKEVDVSIKGSPKEDGALARAALQTVLERYNLRGYGAKIVTSSNIPVARGLKSSSAAANAIILAVLSALGKKAPDQDIVNMSVDAALKAGVTITGAFDDVCACYYGGFHVTKNYAKKSLRRDKAEDDLIVLLHIPSRKIYSGSIDKSKLSSLGPRVRESHRIALRGEYWKAMTMNGFTYSHAFGLNPKIATEAIISGAISAGLSGKGPAVAAICTGDREADVKKALGRFGGKVIKTHPNNTVAKVLSVTGQG